MQAELLSFKRRKRSSFQAYLRVIGSPRMVYPTKALKKDSLPSSAVLIVAWPAFECLPCENSHYCNMRLNFNSPISILVLVWRLVPVRPDLQVFCFFVEARAR